MKRLLGAVMAAVFLQCGDGKPPTGTIVLVLEGTQTSESGGTATAKVSLTAKPTAEVTVPIATSAAGEAVATPATLTFTPDNYNAPQEVVVRGVDDEVPDGDQNFTLDVGPATGGQYTGQTASAGLKNIDNESAGVVIGQPAGVVSEEGTTTQVAIRLQAKPSAVVTVNVSSSDATEGSVAPSVFTFTPANWNANQFVTVTGIDDVLKDGNQTFEIRVDSISSSDSTYSGASPPAPVLVTNIDNDSAGFIVTGPSGNTTETGGQATVSVRLTTQPTGDVKISYASSDATEGTTVGTTLTFTALNWNAPQDIVVTGVNDATEDGNQVYKIAFGPTASTDPDYAAIRPTDVELTNLDDETAGFVFVASDVTTTEDGDQAQFTIALQSQPTADVVVSFASSNPSEGVATGSLTFTAVNWNAPQTVIVTGQNDDVADGNQSFEVTFAAAVSTDSKYNGLVAPAVSLTNLDNDSAGIVVVGPAGDTAEAGVQTTVSVRLASQPTADVTVPYNSSDTSEGTVSGAALTFTPANWNAPQDILITGANDNVRDGDQVYRIDFGAVVSADANYAALVVPPVSLTNVDDETAGIVVVADHVTTTEAGGQDQFTVVLQSEPVADVTISYMSDDTAEGVATGTLTFTAANWNAPQAVIITGQNDNVADGNQPYGISFAPTASADPDYNGLSILTVAVTNLDNDSAGITVSAISDDTTESGGQATFSIVLNSEPTADVTIGYASDAVGEGQAAGSVTFTAVNWNAPQTVVVTGQDDNIDDGDQPYQIDFAATTSADPAYNGRTLASVDVTNIDNDSAGISVSAVAGDTDENGRVTTFTVVLNSQPTANVSLAISSDAPDEGVTDSATLLFTPLNWNAPQTVTVTGQDDNIDDGNQPFQVDFSPAVSTDVNYAGIQPANVDVNNIDNDTAGVTMTAAVGDTSESGATTTFSVVLNSEPTADVTIAIQSDAADEGVADVASLTFATFDWNIPRIVTVTGQNDNLDDGNQSYQITFPSVTSSDPNYNGIALANVGVVNVDDDSAGISVATLDAVSNEGGDIAQIQVVLNSEPTSDVTITLHSSATLEGVPNVTTLLFDVAHWNAPQVVTVTGQNDSIDDGNQAYQLVFDSVVSADLNYNGLVLPNVSITNEDDDTAGIVVSGISGETTEAGGQATFTVVLASQPTGPVTVNFNTDNASEGTPNVTSLSFTTANWNTPQTVTVTGQNDALDDGNVNYQIDFTATTSTDPNYGGQIPASVNVTNVDDDDAPTCGVNLLRGLQSGGTASVVEYTFTGGHTPYRPTMGTMCAEPWYAFGTLCDEPTTTNSQALNTKTDNNSGATWRASPTGEGILVIDVGSVVNFDKLQVYQMFSDGKTTHIRFAIHANSSGTPPPASDPGWTLLTPGFQSVGAGSIAGNVVSNPTEFSPGVRTTRYLRIEARNDGSLGSPNWVELRSVKMFSTACQGGCAGIRAANPVAPSGTYAIAPGGLPSFDVYCDMTGDGGGWTKIVQYSGGGYTISTAAVGAIAAASTASDAKLSDVQINAIRALTGGTATYKIDGSLSSQNAYVQSNGAYDDTLPGFGFGRSSVHSVRACVSDTFAACTLTNAASLAWLDFLHMAIPGGGETCNRYFTGHTSGIGFAHCWSPASTTERCVSGGSTCFAGVYAAHPNAVVWIK